MAETKTVDIAIVGGGMAGCSLALALSGQGMTVALIEARQMTQGALSLEPGINGFDSRVSALTPASAQFLNQLGVWQAITTARACSYTHMAV